MTARRRAAALLLLAAAACTTPAPEPDAAAPELPEPDAAVEDAAEPADAQQGSSTADQAHGWVSDRVVDAAEWLDGFFGTERDDSETNRTRVRLRMDTVWTEGGGADFDLRARVRLHLPETSDRLQLFLAGDDTEELEEGNPAVEAPQDVADQGRGDTAVGAEYFLFDSLKRNLKFEAGVRFRDSRIVPTVGTRFRRTWDYGAWLLRLTERVRWENEFGWESRTGLDFDRVLSERLFLRAGLELSWYEDLEGVYLRQGLLLSQRLDERSALAWTWINDFRSEPHGELDLTRVRVGWRRAYWDRRLYLEVAPELRYARSRDFHPEALLLFRLDLDFGGETVDDVTPVPNPGP